MKLGDMEINHNKKDARVPIIKLAIEILSDVSDIDKITVRQIAERTKVEVGFINYPFVSKDTLLSIAVGTVLAETTTACYR